MAATRMPPPSSAGAMMSPPYGGGGGSMMAGGPSSIPVGGGPPGTLAPGTQIMVGPIVVTVQKYLSQGGFAHVYLVTTDKPIPMPVSATSAPGSTKSTTRGETLHVLKRMAVPDKESLASVRNEVEIHKQLRNHPNIVHFIEASATGLRGGGYEIFILMEYCAGGGIIDLMNARLRTRLKEAEVLKIFGDVAAGLSVMHNLSPPLMHRDLKVENILLAPPPKSNPGVGPTYKLCDFGSSKALVNRKAAQSLDEVKLVEADLNKHTTLQYRAPEMVDVYQRRVIDEKADIWAMGVLLYKLCYYTTPFEENGGGPLAILNARYRFPTMPVYSQRLKDLIASMLQENSSARPSIDEILLRVHRMTGTQPPASVMNKISAAMKKPSESPQRPQPRTSADDLIQVGQTEADRNRADEEALRKQSEAITPMRRGRPTKSTPGNASSTAMAAAKFEQAAITAGNNRGSSSMIKSPSNSLISPSSGAFSPDRATPPLGFADSFAPSTLKSGSNRDLTNDSSRPGSALDHSPSLPGFDASSARVSPLPPPITSVSSQSPPAENKEDDTSSRFPSVEELDRRYPTEVKKPSSSSSIRSVRSPPIASPPPPQSRSPHASIQSNIPGLSNRAPVSAMADKFGAMASKRSSVPVQSKPLPPVGVKPSGLSSIGNRWPHQQQSATEETGRRNSAALSPTSSISEQRVPPSLPSRKHDWLQRDGTGNKATETIDKQSKLQVQDKSDDSSGEEDNLPPEDLDAPVNTNRGSQIPSTFAQAKERALAKQNESTTYKSSYGADAVPGKVKTPDWVKQERLNETVGSTKPVENQSNEDVQKLKESQFDEYMNGQQQKAKPPAWDEDDEEMHFLPQPSIHSTPSGQPLNRVAPAAAEIKSSGRLIDFDDEPQQEEHAVVQSVLPSTSTPAKQYVDAATSPRQGSPAEEEEARAMGSMVNKFEKVQIESVQDDNAFKKPIPPTKPGNIQQLYRQESVSNGKLSSNEEQDQISRLPPTVASKPQRLSASALTSNVPKKSASMPPTTSAAVLPPTNRMNKPTSFSQSQFIAPAPPPPQNLKPWEKEAMEKERVEKFGSLRSRSPVKQYVQEQEDLIAASSSGDKPIFERNNKGEAQERFQGVSSLISQWQANASKGAPGWGTVGGGEGVEGKNRTSMMMEGGGNRVGEKKRMNSKDEDEIYRASKPDRSTSIQRRLPSREV